MHHLVGGDAEDEFLYIGQALEVGKAQVCHSRNVNQKQYAEYLIGSAFHTVSYSIRSSR